MDTQQLIANLLIIYTGLLLRKLFESFGQKEHCKSQLFGLQHIIEMYASISIHASGMASVLDMLKGCRYLRPLLTPNLRFGFRQYKGPLGTWPLAKGEPIVGVFAHADVGCAPNLRVLKC